jgi:hypothetical protein
MHTFRKLPKMSPKRKAKQAKNQKSAVGEIRVTGEVGRL